MSDSPFARDLAVTLEREGGDDGEIVLRLPLEERNTMFGHLHGGALAALLPLSTSSALGDEAAEACTVSMHLQYAKAARRPVVARTKLVRRARELGFFETMIRDEEGNAIAAGGSTVSLGIPRVAEGAAAPGALDPGAPQVAAAIREAIAASPYLSRRGLKLVGSAVGVAELSLAANEQNLDGQGRLHEGAVLSLIDAAGATSPSTMRAPDAGTGGATIALHAQILGPLPAEELVARATVRARQELVSWVEVQVVSTGSGQLHALGTVVYRFRQA